MINIRFVSFEMTLKTKSDGDTHPHVIPLYHISLAWVPSIRAFPSMPQKIFFSRKKDFNNVCYIRNFCLAIKEV